MQKLLDSVRQRFLVDEMPFGYINAGHFDSGCRYSVTGKPDFMCAIGIQIDPNTPNYYDIMKYKGSVHGLVTRYPILKEQAWTKTSGEFLRALQHAHDTAAQESQDNAERQASLDKRLKLLSYNYNLNYTPVS